MSGVVTGITVVSIPEPTDGSAMDKVYPTDLTDEQWTSSSP